MESEGHEEKYRAVIDNTPKMNRSAKGGARSSLHWGGEGVLIPPVRPAPRRLADWINPTGDKKVHSLIDKV
jgi:hypothetical protein